MRGWTGGVGDRGVRENKEKDGEERNRVIYRSGQEGGKIVNSVMK